MAKLISKGIVKAAGMMKMDNRINYFKVTRQHWKRLWMLRNMYGKPPLTGS